MNYRLLGGAQLRFAVADSSQVGECRRAALRLAEACEFDATSAGRVGIVANELATNLLRHARSGELLLQIIGEGSGAQVELLAVDRGPGMSDVDRCLRDGFSTAGTAGTGLGAVSRLSAIFDIYSAPTQGTVVLSRIASGTSKPAVAPNTDRSDVDFGAVCVALTGEIECGDTWRIAMSGNAVALLVVDGLGHGTLAAAAAGVAATAFGAGPFDDPADIMRRLHLRLPGTRGVAAACALLQPSKSRITYCGVGNIAGAIVSPERSRGMVSHNGTLGVQLLRAQQFEYDWPAGSSIVMHSDGLSNRWALADHFGLAGRHPALIAAALYRDHGRARDDATVVVVARS